MQTKEKENKMTLPNRFILAEIDFWRILNFKKGVMPEWKPEQDYRLEHSFIRDLQIPLVEDRLTKRDCCEAVLFLEIAVRNITFHGHRPNAVWVEANWYDEEAKCLRMRATVQYQVKTTFRERMVWRWNNFVKKLEIKK